MKYEKFDILKKAKYSIVPNNRAVCSLCRM